MRISDWSSDVCSSDLAAVPPALRVEWLVDAEATDRLVAIAALREPRRMDVRDVARDEAMERIDRLQEEVARIARLLGDLAGSRGLPGTPVDHGAHGDGRGDHKIGRATRLNSSH